MNNYKWSFVSRKRLMTCHQLLEQLMREALKSSPMDMSIACGRRDERTQNEAFAKGYSALKYPNSKHNKNPSEAIDIWPSPLNWKEYTQADAERFYILACHIKIVAYRLNISVRWGGDFPTIFAEEMANGTIERGNFDDMPHWELITREQYLSDLSKLLRN